MWQVKSGTWTSEGGVFLVLPPEGGQGALAWSSLAVRPFIKVQPRAANGDFFIIRLPFQELFFICAVKEQSYPFFAARKTSLSAPDTLELLTLAPTAPRPKRVQSRISSPSSDLNPDLPSRPKRARSRTIAGAPRSFSAACKICPCAS